MRQKTTPDWPPSSRSVSIKTRASGGAPASLPERLDYIAQMVRQLQMMSAPTNCRTLTGLLELAYHEALQKRRGY
jgi:hypothetical protein